MGHIGDGAEVVQQVAECLKDRPRLRVSIMGHSCGDDNPSNDAGDPSDLRALRAVKIQTHQMSLNRAKQVAVRLLGLGVATGSCLKPVGRGDELLVQRCKERSLPWWFPKEAPTHFGAR